MIATSDLEMGKSVGSSGALTLTPPKTFKPPWRYYETPFDDLINHKYAGSGTQEDPYLVEWLPNDPENAMTWPRAYKWYSTIFLAISTLSVSLASSAYSGGILSIAQQFPSSTVVLTLGVSLYVLGFAFGPLLWAPFSEVLGRRNLFIFTYAMFTMWQGVTIVSSDTHTLLIFRFLAGFFGASPLVNSGGTLADMFTAKERGLAVAVFSAAPFMGPALGPITGGFLGMTSGWKWVLGYLTIFAAVIVITGAVTLPESYAPVLLRWRAQRLTEFTGKIHICKLDKGKDVRLWPLMRVSLLRPWQLLLSEPIVLILSLYIAIVYGTLYSLFGAFPIVFQRGRGWNTGIAGLAFVGVLIGMISAVLYIIFYENPRYIRTSAERAASPEDRLPSAMVGAVSIIVGLAIFAATDGPEVHWIAPVVAGAPFGCGMVLIFLGLMNYLCDSYLIYAASVLAANSVIRSLFGFAFPLFTPNMYAVDKLNGIHWGAGIAGILSLICLPFPFIFARYGEAIRKKCKYSAEAAALLAELQGSASAPKPDPTADTKAPAKEFKEDSIECSQNPAAVVEVILDEKEQSVCNTGKEQNVCNMGSEDARQAAEEVHDGRDGEAKEDKMSKDGSSCAADRSPSCS
eukprot:RCo036078